MNFFGKMYCRVCQIVMRMLSPMLPYREPKVLSKIEDIVPVLQEQNIDKVLVVTDSGIVDAGLATRLTEVLKNAQISFEQFSDVVPNPTEENVESGYSQYLQGNCKGIIAIGGGSVIDCAKVIGARVSNPKKPVSKMKGLLKVKNKLPFLCAIPTTAGTGSETTLSAVITDSSAHKKYIINDFKLIPTYAVLDASLTLNLPKFLTAITGMDALTHAVEAFIGKSTTEKSRKDALEAIRLVIENLPKAYSDGHNERARANMLKASYLAGLSFSKSYVGYVHAIAHSLGGKYNTPHGLANAVILPYTLSIYDKSIMSKVRTLALYCDVAKPFDNEQMATSKFINHLFQLLDMFEIPRTFDFIEEEDIEELAKSASKEANPLYPVPVLMDAKELTKIYYKIKA